MKRKVALCVAEKPTVAKSVAEFLSRGNFRKVRKKRMNNSFLAIDDVSVQVQPDL